MCEKESINHCHDEMKPALLVSHAANIGAFDYFDVEIPNRNTHFQQDETAENKNGLFRVFSGCPVDPCAIMQFLWDRYRPLRSSLAADRAPASHKSLITFMLA